MTVEMGEHPNHFEPFDLRGDKERTEMTTVLTVMKTVRKIQYLQLNVTNVDNGFKIQMALFVLPTILVMIIATYCVAGRFCCQVPLVPGQGYVGPRIRQLRKLSSDVAALDISMWDIEDDEPHHAQV